MRIPIFVAVAFLVSLTLVCSSNDDESPTGVQFGDLQGHVYQAGTTDPVSAVSISCNNNLCVSAADGSFSLTDIPTGSYELTAQKQGYLDYSTTVNISSGTTTHDILLQPITFTCSIDGFVTDAETGRELAGVIVSCAGQSDTTNSSGAYFFPDVPGGGQTLTASFADYEPYSAAVVVPEGRLIHDFEMTPNFSYATITGTVTNAVDGAIEGALISVGAESSYSDASGNYSLEDVRQGLSTLTCTHDHYADIATDLVIDDPELVFDIVMIKTVQETLFVTKDTYAAYVPGQEHNTHGDSDFLYCDWGAFPSKVYVGLPSLPTNIEIDHVDRAELHLWMVSVEPMIWNTCVNYRRVTSPWSESTLSYANSPEVDSVQYARHCYDNDDEGSFVTIDVLLFYQYWPAELSSGFRLSTGSGYAKIASSNNGIPAIRPFVLIETHY